MKRLIASAAMLALVATACSASGAQPLGPAPSSEPTASPSSGADDPSSPTPAAEPPDELWFNQGGFLFATHRSRSFVPSSFGGPSALHHGFAVNALEALLEGPSETERAAHIGSAINPGTRLLAVSIDRGVATVNLDQTFTGEETPAIAVGSLSQIVYTLTQDDFIRGVLFEVEGEPLTNFGGYELDGAQRRDDFADQLPWILVESPGFSEPSEQVSSPVTIAGSADVFEAVVSISILDQRGDVIASTFTTATCGTGCRGSYSTEVDYSIDTRQPGTIHVYEVSAMDGTPIHDVFIPVTLTA